MPVVTELTQTCEACPAQWSGRTDDGCHVYIRYRWGRLECGIADTRTSAVVGRVHVADIGGEYDGYIDEAQMVTALSGVLRFDMDATP